MWLSPKIFSILEVAKDSVDGLKQALAAVTAERDLLKDQLTKSTIMCDWLRVKVNGLEIANAALMEKAYNIHVPAPELIRHHPIPAFDPMDFTGFEDVGDETAHKLGLPLHGDKQ